MRIILPFKFLILTLTFTSMLISQARIKAVALVRGFDDPNIEGVISFVQEGDMTVRIRGEIRGLIPGQVYAIHIHEYGDCRDPGASGGHFDPYRTETHGNPHYPVGTHHSGDLPNIKANDDGVARINFSTKAITVSPSPYSVLGRAIVIHERADDYKSQPAGNAGSRIACGIIGLAKE
jgi:Cu-Zn family superoxide dismutase